MAGVLSIFRTATDGACGISREQRVVLWNRAAESMLGFESSEVLGRHCFEVFRGSDEDGCVVCRRRCPISEMVQRTDAAPTAILRAQRKDGKGLWLSVSTLVIPSRFNAEAAFVHLFRDVSHQKTCESAVDELVASMLTTTSSGEAGVSSEFAPPNPTPCLTDRENEVLRHLAVGETTREIAEALFVSPSTVRNHIHNILAKLGVHSRLGAVTTALRFGLL